MKSPETTLKRPTALTVVALLFFLIGLAGVLNDVTQSGGFPIPSWSLLNMIAGLGLLKCWRGWRGYALFVAVVSLATLVPFSIFAMFNPEEIVFKFPSILRDQRDHPVLPRLIVGAVFSLYIVGAAWMVKTLLRRDVRALFRFRHA
jgi:hypothetical protein